MASSETDGALTDRAKGPGRNAESHQPGKDKTFKRETKSGGPRETDGALSAGTKGPGSNAGASVRTQHSHI